MGNLLNGDFESGTGGVADSWMTQATSTYEEVALLGTANRDSETFEEEWTTGYLFVFDPLVNIVAPIFDSSIGEGETFEDFNEGWSQNHGYSFLMGTTTLAVFDTAGTPESVEDFEELWASNEGYSYVMGTVTAASFDTAGTPESVEDFEELWASNQGYSYVMGTVTAAVFDGTSPESFEDFEESIAPAAVTLDSATSKVVRVSHGLTNGTKVKLSSSGALPSGLSTEVTYFVVGATTNDFQVSVTSGGSAATFTASGFGDVRVSRDPKLYWLTFLE